MNKKVSLELTNPENGKTFYVLYSPEEARNMAEQLTFRSWQIEDNESEDRD